MVNDEIIDTLIEIHTPERVSFSVSLCGPFPRLWAALLDGFLLVLFLGMMQLALLVITGASQSSFGVFLTVMFVMEWGYKMFFEILMKGQTPGKRSLGLRVMSADGGPLRPGQAIIRNLVRAFEGVAPFGYLPALISMSLTSRFQRLGDLAAGTIVVWEPEDYRKKSRLQSARSRQLVNVMEMLPVRLELGGRMIKLIEEYVEYRQRLSRERLNEIAAPLADLLRNKYSLPPEVSSDVVMVAIAERLKEASVNHAQKVLPP